ncbi:hypothetical protein EV183_000127 [Coemansia sp. RSA 2336]|nr:hypothetical protein EV183_000127 [Coemansia sp. RSA 2336]
MEAQPKPLLNYAQELLQSYSRLIVYSGDILRSLPEPREGLSLANFKTKKDENTSFLREWQHLESVLDEYLIRLNDIRTRAHEELDAARVRRLAGEDIDLTLPEAVYKLNLRLTKYKQQYDALQNIVNGGSFADIADKFPQDTAMEVDSSNSSKPALPETTPQAQTVHAGPSENQSSHNTSQAPEPAAANAAMPPAANIEQSQGNEHKQEPESQSGSVIDVDAEDDDELFRGSPNMASEEPIELDSDSDIDDDDDDEAMKDMFDS